MTALLLLQVLAARPALTPGAAWPVTRAQVCAAPYVSDLGRPVDASMWRTVLTRYGLAWEDRYAYQPDWLVPTSLGGQHVAANLWPAWKASEWNATRKLQVAERVYRELCAGRLHVLEAQQKAVVSWVTTYRIYFAP